MVTWSRMWAVAAAIVVLAGTTAYAAGRSETGNDSGKSRQLAVLKATVDRANERVILSGQHFGAEAPQVYCETFPLTVLDFTDTEVAVWFPAAVPQGTDLFSVVRGRGH